MIGGVLPFIGWRTTNYGNMEFAGFYTAWLKKGILWSGTLRPRRK